MMKKISFGKLRERLNKRANNKSIKNEEKDCEEECGRNPIDVNYDRLLSTTPTNQRIDSNTSPETTHKSLKFPAELLQSFRNKFKRNHNKEKVNSVSKLNHRKELNKSKTDLVPNNELVVNHNEIDLNKELKRSDVSEEKPEKCQELIEEKESETKPKLDLYLDESTSCSSKQISSHNMENELQMSEGIFDESVENIVKRNDKKFSLIEEIEKLVSYGWYWGPITRSEAEQKLRDQMDGSFLVRDSSDNHYLFSLSFRSYGRTLHTRIEYTNGLFSFYANTSSEGHLSIIELIEESMSNSEKGVFCYSRGGSSVSPSFPVRLTRPVSRFSEVRSLQYLCKFIIRQSTNYRHIQSLPLPQSIKGFIKNGRY